MHLHKRVDYVHKLGFEKLCQLRILVHILNIVGDRQNSKEVTIIFIFLIL